MKTVKMLQNEDNLRKGKLYNVTTRHAEQLADQGKAEIIEGKENKEEKTAKDRKTK